MGHTWTRRFLFFLNIISHRSNDSHMLASSSLWCRPHHLFFPPSVSFFLYKAFKKQVEKGKRKKEKNSKWTMRRTSVCSHAESPALHCLSLKITFYYGPYVCVLFFWSKSLEATQVHLLPSPFSLSNRSRYTLDRIVIIDLIQIEKRLMTGRYTNTCFSIELASKKERKQIGSRRWLEWATFRIVGVLYSSFPEFFI